MPVYVSTKTGILSLDLPLLSYFLPRTAGRISDTRNAISALIAVPIRMAGVRCPKRIPAITATAEGVSPK